MSNLPTTATLSTMDDIVRMGKVMSESGMFTDAKDAAKAIVKIQAGQELGIPPFQAMSGIHIISGKPAIGAGLMAAMIDKHEEYDFEVLQHTDKVCEIKFFKNGKVKGISKFTAEDARKAGTKNMDKYPANMLYARAMSNGAKWYCPGVFGGPVYTPEEMGEEEVQDVPHVVMPEEKPKKQASKQKEEAPEVVEAEAVEEAPAKQASVKEKTDLLLLLNNKHITSDEKAKMLEGMDKLDSERCLKAIEKIRKVISDREAADKAA